MPIKLPKAFPRRKSSGNALEEFPTPAEPSFRVLERPSSRSFEGPDSLKRLSQGRPLSAGAGHLRSQPYNPQGNNDNLNANNRGSGATNNSASSGGQDNSSFSARFSSSSTLPSSTDVPIDDKPLPKHSNTMPAPPVPESGGMASIRAAGRAFSFGRKKAESQLPNSRPIIEHAQSDGRANYTRERAYTENSYTSESTATPPKLLDTGLDFGSTENFGLMFEGIGKRSSQIESGSGFSGSQQTERSDFVLPASKISQGNVSSVTGSPHDSDTLHDQQYSPRSWASRDSQDELMASPSYTMERTFSYEGAEERINYPFRPSKSRTMPLASSTTPPQRERPNRPPSDGLRRSSAYAKPREDMRHSTLFRDDDNDDDAKLVMSSIAASRRLDGGFQDSDDDDNPAASLVQQSRQTPSPQVTAGAQQYTRITTHSPGPALDKAYTDLPSDMWQPSSANTTPRAKKPGVIHQEERSMFDASPPLPEQNPQKRPPRVQPPPMPRTPNKIMTPAQFERYRKEQEMNQAVNTQTNPDASDDEGDDYEDDDEIERNKQLAKQRRKQEAHLAVYRQQMMKVTGEQHIENSSVQLRPSMDRSSMSAPNLQQRASSIEINFDKPSDDGKASDDEDEDVPLGVLAAHGFPSKNRPPTAMSGKEPRIQYKSESYPPPSASTSGASQAGRASGLPPFAKNLPQDPYYGASLVNPSNRESLAYGHQGPPSNTGGNSPHVPSAGLVGVIAGEERARAARRGSPNAQGNFSSPLPQQMGQMPSMPPGMPPMMSPGEMATVQMSEQMSQMMQMQVQWMQQMQQMMAPGMQFQPGQQMPMPPGQPGMMMPPVMPPMPGQLPRPPSSGPPPGPGAPGLHAQAGRAMSMMATSPTPPWPPNQVGIRQSRAPSLMNGGLAGAGPGYTPSIAPSERSNVGMPSRYRPVSIAAADEHRSGAYSRSSTMNSNTLQPGDPGRDDRLSTSRERKSNLSLRPATQATSRKAGSDDDEEEGWEEMKKKRDRKRGLWRLNRKIDEPVEPALEYYDYTET